MSRLVASGRRQVARYPFEVVVLSLAVVYAVAHLSPSSYGIALDRLGEPSQPLFGSTRAIRSDEWSVMTPLFQAAVNNEFHETNGTSFYGESLRSVIGLPLLDWGLLFKPLVWAFFVVPPALAYSIYWAANAALMLIGWSLLLRGLGFGRTTAGFTSAILFFSPFVQAWTLGPQLALFPWVLLAVTRIASNVRMAMALALLVPVWWIGLFYPPGVPPLLYLGLALCLAFRPEVFRWRRLVSILVGATVGVAITLAYFAPVLHAYAESVYPGDRWFRGGGLPAWQAASQFLPGTTTELFENLVAENISEAATVASWLPLLALCVVDTRRIRARYGSEPDLRRDVRRLWVLGLMWLVITLWQLVPVPPLSYALGLGLSPETRTLFGSGALLLIAAAYAVDRLPLRVTPSRLSVFGSVVVVAWLLASFDLQSTGGLALRDELLVLIVVLFAAPTLAVVGGGVRGARVAVLVIALLPTMLVWGFFNPLQDTRVIFRKPDSPVTKALDALAAQRPDGALAVGEFPGAVLNGVGYASVTHVLVTPTPEVFRKYFPDMDERTFNEIFNRYAQITLTARARPYVADDDVIRVPIRTMSYYATPGPLEVVGARPTRPWDLPQSP